MKLPHQVGIIGHRPSGSPQRADAFDRGRKSWRWHRSTFGRAVALRNPTSDFVCKLKNATELSTVIERMSRGDERQHVTASATRETMHRERPVRSEPNGAGRMAVVMPGTADHVAVWLPPCTVE